MEPAVAITWPPERLLRRGEKSTLAFYGEQDLDLVRCFIRQYERGEIGVEEMRQQIDVFHALKHEFGMMEHVEPEPQPEPLPDPGKPDIGRFSDPEKSGAPEAQRLGAIAVYPRSGTQRRRVLDALWYGPKAGMTDDEIEAATKLEHRRASTRRKELELLGWVQDSGRRKMGVSKVPLTVYELTPAGRDAYSSLEDQDDLQRRRRQRRMPR